MVEEDGLEFYCSDSDRPRIYDDVSVCLGLPKFVSTNLTLASTMPNIRVLRDIKARHGVQASEIARRAYLYVARNQSLPPQVRHQAQLQLNSFGRYTRPTTVKNRCYETGRGRGIMSEFGLCRVSLEISLWSCVCSKM